MRAIRSTRPRAASLSVHSRGFLTAAAYKLAQKLLPKMSETEKVALGCGTVGFDRDIFTGSPSLKHLLDTYKPKLSADGGAIFGLRAVRMACGGARAWTRYGTILSSPDDSWLS